VQSFKLKFLGVTILQGVEFPIFLLISEWALQQCSATALPVIANNYDCSAAEFKKTLSTLNREKKSMRQCHAKGG